MDVSIIIVSWNTRDLLRNCLRSIQQQTVHHSFEVFVVDNASRDGSAAMVRDQFPAVHLIANSDNRGFAAANNQAIREARGRYVLLLNPDTIILDRAIERSVTFADVHPDTAVVGCQVWSDDNTVQRTGFAFPGPVNLILALSGLSRLLPRSKLFGRPELGWWNRDTETDLEVVSGMFMLVRRTAIEQVGLLDEDYFVYAEEADWCFRFAKAGWRRRFTPAARILHLDGGGKSSGQVSARMYVQLQKSLLIYFRKNLGASAWVAGRMIFIGSNLVRAFLWTAQAVLPGRAGSRSKSAAAVAALRFHILGIEPT